MDVFLRVDSGARSFVLNPLAGAGTNTRRRRLLAEGGPNFSVPVRATRRRTGNERQMAPLENIIQEFIINLSGFEWDAVGIQGQGSPL